MQAGKLEEICGLLAFASIEDCRNQRSVKDRRDLRGKLILTELLRFLSLLPVGEFGCKSSEALVVEFEEHGQAKDPQF